MLSVYVQNGNVLERRPVENGTIPPNAVWIDIIRPSKAEDALVEKFVGIAVPTREEMQEIEVSSRLYVENAARYMTATLMCQSDTPVPKTTPVLLMDLLDAVIDRAADILERISADIDGISRDIFEPEPDKAEHSYTIILKTIGQKGDLTSKVRESLVSINRLLLFLANEAEGMRWAKDTRLQLQSMQRDVASLSDHVSYLSSKIIFLLDATLGMVSLEQNDIIKIFSVAAVVLLPPSLVASIYGMNFKHMPELEWYYGYPLALVLILLAAVLPYYFFKWRKWL